MPRNNLIAQYHEGQEVEVYTSLVEPSPCAPYGEIRNWCHAKIIHQFNDGYMVQFHDGPTTWFSSENIRIAAGPNPYVFEGGRAVKRTT